MKKENENVVEIDKSLIEGCYNFDYDIIEFNAFNSSNWTFDITQGMMIFFLSNLRHESINFGKKILIN